jgi:hypothetical protein
MPIYYCVQIQYKYPPNNLANGSFNCLTLVYISQVYIKTVPIKYEKMKKYDVECCCVIRNTKNSVLSASIPDPDL